jgi:hypothetical protein
VEKLKTKKVMINKMDIELDTKKFPEFLGKEPDMLIFTPSKEYLFFKKHLPKKVKKIIKWLSKKIF